MCSNLKWRTRQRRKASIKKTIIIKKCSVVLTLMYASYSFSVGYFLLPIKIICSRKWASPCTGRGSLNDPTPMLNAAAASFSPAPSSSASLPSSSSSLSLGSSVADVTLAPSSLWSSSSATVVLRATCVRSVGSDISNACSPFGRTSDLNVGMKNKRLNNPKNPIYRTSLDLEFHRFN